MPRGGGSAPSRANVKLTLEEVIFTVFLEQIGKLKSTFLAKLLLFLPVIPLSLLIISSAAATPAGELDGQISGLEARSGVLDDSYRQALADMVAVDSEVNHHTASIQQAGQRREEVQAELESEEQYLEEVQAQLARQQSLLEKRLQGAYKSDEMGFLAVVMSAGDFSDFLNRMDLISLIAEEDRRLILSIEESRTAVEARLVSLSDKKQELASLIEELGSAQDSLLAAQAEQQRVVSGIEAQMRDNQDQLAQLQTEAAAIQSRMSQIQSNSAPSGGGGGYAPPPSGGGTHNMTATAYCLQGTTATGMQAGRGVIAVDPGVIRLGSRVHVSGYGDAIAADTGGAIRGNKIDVWLPCGEAIAWGVRTVTVTVY